MKKLYFIIVALFLVNGVLAQWVAQNSGTTSNLNSVYFPDVNTGYTVGDSGTILKTTDGGANWALQNSNTTASLASVHFPAIDTGYAVGVGSVLKTTNGGVDWINQSSPIAEYLNSVFFTTPDTGYAVGGYQQGDSAKVFILKTTNGGSLWSINYIYGDTASDGGLNSVYFTDANTGYAVGSFKNNSFANSPYYRSIIVKTTNGGIDWTMQNQYGSDLKSVYFPNADTGYSVGVSVYRAMTFFYWGYVILKTTNSGTNWALDYTFCDYYYYFGKGLCSVYFTDANIGYTTGQGESYQPVMLKTTDGATEWTDQDIGGNNLNSIYFPATDTGYAVGENGVILKTTNGGEGGHVGINDQHQTPSTLTISPNPASTIITIETPIKGSLTIHNLGGQELLKITVSESKTNIDISTLIPGLYIVKLTEERGVSVGKIIKQ
jgi:photosystem II stability/assembly factor-like uncharacterized protein